MGNIGIIGSAALLPLNIAGTLSASTLGQLSAAPLPTVQSSPTVIVHLSSTSPAVSLAHIALKSALSGLYNATILALAAAGGTIATSLPLVQCH